MHRDERTRSEGGGGRGKKLRGRPERRLYRKLARAWHYPSVEAYLADRTSAEITEDIAEYRLEPFGELRGDMHAAIVASAAANAFADSGSKAEDYLLDFENDPHEEQSAQDQIAVLQQITDLFEERERREQRKP